MEQKKARFYLLFNFHLQFINKKNMKRQTDPYGKRWGIKQKNKTKNIYFNKVGTSPCRKEQFAVSYFSTTLIVLIQVYNWEIRHHSLVYCGGFADILNIL